MLSSIHPLGERGRHNRWGVTVAAFTVGAAAAGAGVGALLGYAGSLTLSGLDASALLVSTGVVIGGAALLDTLRPSPLSTARQVNEHWIGHYRGWVYGSAFGFQLGVGVATYVVTWGVYATFVTEFLTASPIGGAIVGAVFGLGRSVTLLLAGWIDRPSRLTAFHERMSRLGPAVSRISVVGLSSLGILGLLGVLL